MKKWIRDNRLNIFIIFLLLVGFLVRVYFVNKVVVGDLLSYVEWGKRLFQSNPKDFYFSQGWYYSEPNYPPFAEWVFAGLLWLNDKRFVLAQMHNLIRFPLSAFIVYFYQWGEIFMVKLLPILCDLGLSLIVYKVIYELTESSRKALLGFVFFLFNPVTIFISGVWGQTDSVVALLGMISFLLLLRRKVIVSIPVLFLSLYFKPSWSIIVPLYLFILYEIKPKVWELFCGAIISLFIFVAATAPFSNTNVFSYGWKLFRTRYQISLGNQGKASISAFNFQTIFMQLDIDYAHKPLLGIASGTWGDILFFLTNIFAFHYFHRSKEKLLGMISGLFTIGFGSFLFMPTMLERYFFPGFAPLVILTFSKPKIMLAALVSNLILAANILYSFYRRGSDPIYHFFIDHNFLVIKLTSIAQVAVYFYILKMIQFGNGKRAASRSPRPY